MSQFMFMTPGSYQDRSVGGEMWQFPSLRWSSFCRFPRISEWNVSIVECIHDSERACSLVGTCTSPLKRFWRGQHRMTREVWTSGVDRYMKSGLGRSRVPSSALKENILSRSTLLC